ncbi:hypothetical protein [Actinomadura viridis]|uniref:Uncharacterized protein n=1 Tax=Actinomadura viridis TaxID=58110 RepID=A0A931DDG2_9ACTN|nr:hypothetical protein [Actinomadura viridis]MBG6086352.1 hypothetical protein [Actinomadura viridis]
MTGVPMLVLVLIVDVLLPLRRQGRRLGTWLGMAALIPIPFAVCLSLT